MIPRSVDPKRPLVWMAAVISIVVTGLTIPKTLAGSVARKSGETKATRTAHLTAPIQFTADFEFGGNTQRYYRKGDKTRQDRSSGWTARLVDKTKRSVRILIVRQKAKSYVDMTAEAPDYFVDLGAWVARNYKRVGVEKVNGYDCIKYVSHDANSTCWFSTRLDLSVKQVDKGPMSRVLEYRNIRECPVSDSVFDVPAGYRREIPRN